MRIFQGGIYSEALGLVLFVVVSGRHVTRKNMDKYITRSIGRCREEGIMRIQVGSPSMSARENMQTGNFTTNEISNILHGSWRLNCLTIIVGFNIKKVSERIIIQWGRVNSVSTSYTMADIPEDVWRGGLVLDSGRYGVVKSEGDCVGKPIGCEPPGRLLSDWKGCKARGLLL